MLIKGENPVKNKFTPSLSWEKGTYLFHKIQLNPPYTLSVKLKPGKTIPIDLYFGITDGDYHPGISASWSVNEGRISRSSLTVTRNDMYISIFPNTYLGRIFELFDIQLEEGSTATEYENPIKSYLTTDSNKLMEEMN